MMATLGEQLPEEISRVRDELIPQYESIGPPGAFAIAMMRRALQEADCAMISGDTVAMIRVYEELKGFKS
jgi:hypothetical protein